MLLHVDFCVVPVLLYVVCVLFMCCLQQSLSGDPESMKPVRSGPLSGLLRPSRTSEELLDDPVIGIIRSLNRLVFQLIY